LATKFYKYNAENLLRIYHTIQSEKFSNLSKKPINLFQEKIYKSLH
jgi:hypothetical protein